MIDKSLPVASTQDAIKKAIERSKWFNGDFNDYTFQYHDQMFTVIDTATSNSWLCKNVHTGEVTSFHSTQLQDILFDQMNTRLTQIETQLGATQTALENEIGRNIGAHQVIERLKDVIDATRWDIENRGLVSPETFEDIEFYGRREDA